MSTASGAPGGVLPVIACPTAIARRVERALEAGEEVEEVEGAA